jgi:hypothetical protein
MPIYRKSCVCGSYLEVPTWRHCNRCERNKRNEATIRRKRLRPYSPPRDTGPLRLAQWQRRGLICEEQYHMLVDMIREGHPPEYICDAFRWSRKRFNRATGAL